MEVVEENSRKISFNTLDKTPLLIGSISSQFSGENSFNGVGKTSSKTTKKSYRKQPPNAPIYRAPKTSRYGPDRADGRPPGRPPTVRFLTVGAAVDRPGRPRPGYREQSLCPVDRGFPESRALWTVDRPGRSALQPDTGVHAVHVLSLIHI